MIIDKLYRIRVAVVSSLLMAFATVFVCGVLCDLGVVDLRMQSSSVAAEGHHQSSHDHFWMASSSGEENNHSHDRDNDSDLVSHHQHSETDDCCEEERQEWFATVVKQELPDFQVVTIPILLWEVKLPDTFVILSEIFERRNEFRNALSPPGSQIRILLQSFLC